MGLLINRKEFRLASKLSDRAISIAPKSAEHHWLIWYSLWKTGKHNEALIASHKAIKLNPNIACAYKNLGVIYKEKGQLDQALEATLKAIELKPDYADAYNLIGIIEESERDVLYGFTGKACSFNSCYAANQKALDNYVSSLIIN